VPSSRRMTSLGSPEHSVFASEPSSSAIGPEACSASRRTSDLSAAVDVDTLLSQRKGRIWRRSRPPCPSRPSDARVPRNSGLSSNTLLRRISHADGQPDGVGGCAVARCEMDVVHGAETRVPVGAVVGLPFVVDPSCRRLRSAGRGLDAGLSYALAGSQISWEISIATSDPWPLARGSTTPVTAQMTLLSHR
jgi:hypothetical protein